MLLSSARSSACNTPVFRYALENWPPDNYIATVFHRGELTAAQRAAIAGIGAEANIKVATVDVAMGVPEGHRQAWAAVGSTLLPAIVVSYPSSEERKPAWAGPLDGQVVKALVDSPMRRELSKRLLAGEAAVWVFLESGEKSADDAAERMVQTALAKVQREWQPPEPRPGEALADNALPSAVRFSVLRVSRRADQEFLLVRLLLGLDESLQQAKGPIVFPTFGRGRVLGGLAGKQLTEDVVAEACEFLTGACSCQIKEENPGTDLLLSADWSTIAESQTANPLPTAIVPAPEDSPARAATAEPALRERAAATPPGFISLRRNMIIVASIALAAIIIGTVLVMRRGATKP